MKRTIIVLISLVVGGILLWIALRAFHVISFNRPSTSGMSPNIEVGQLMVSSCLKEPTTGDPVCYRTSDPYNGEYIAVHRAMAFGGETVELKRGLIYVNGELIDDSLKLKFNYIIPEEAEKKATARLQLNEQDIQFLEHFHRIALTPEEAQEYKATRDIIFTNNGIYGNPGWNANFWGPMKVPHEHCFVLGDNRDNSADSRYKGFIHMNDVVSTIIN